MEKYTIPGGDVAVDDRSEHPPRTPASSHADDSTYRDDASATVPNSLEVVIDGYDAAVLVDNGTDYSVLSAKCFLHLQKVRRLWEGPQIRTAVFHLTTPVGRCTGRIEIHTEKCPVKFVVLEDSAREIILGMGFLCYYGAFIDPKANRLTLPKSISTPEDPEVTSAAVRVLVERVDLPPLSSIFLPVGANTVMCGEALMEGRGQLLLVKGIDIARGVTQLENGLQWLL